MDEEEEEEGGRSQQETLGLILELMALGKEGDSTQVGTCICQEERFGLYSLDSLDQQLCGIYM